MCKDSKSDKVISKQSGNKSNDVINVIRQYLAAAGEILLLFLHCKGLYLFAFASASK